jgi:hypothetical protein
VVKVLTQLAATPNHKFLTGDMLAGLVDAAVGAVATKPELLEEVEDAWIRTLVRSVTFTVAGQSIRKTFSRDGLTRILSEMMGTFAVHPELIIAKPGLGQELTRGVLTELSGLDRFNAEHLANAAIGGALNVLADRPELAGTNYPMLVAALAGKIGGLVKDRSITRIQGNELLSAMAESVAENEKLFLEGSARLAEIIVDAVLDTSGEDHGRLIAGAALVDVVLKVTEAMAVNGRKVVDDHPQNILRKRLVEVLNAGLARALDQLGRQLSAKTVPLVLSGLIAAWARGEIHTIDPDNQDFQNLFETLALRAAE